MITRSKERLQGQSLSHRVAKGLDKEIEVILLVRGLIVSRGDKEDSELITRVHKAESSIVRVFLEALTQLIQIDFFDLRDLIIDSVHEFLIVDESFEVDSDRVFDTRNSHLEWGF